MMWGVESEVTARFGKAGIAAENIHFHKADWTFRFNGTPNEFVALFKNYYGPTMNAFEAAQQKGMAELLQQELEALFASHNASKVPNQTIITATYLQVVADVPTQEHTSTGKSRPVLH
jgi:hypothetical protein